MYVLNENIKNIKIFTIKFSILTPEKKNLCILHGQVFIMHSHVNMFASVRLHMHNMFGVIILNNVIPVTGVTVQDKSN